MSGIFTVVAVGLLGVLIATFLVGILRTIRDGMRTAEEFDRAGFTLDAVWHGRLPETDAGSSLAFSDCAEMTVTDGKISVKPTRTISKTIS
jgi:hypothetical protein